MNGEARSRFSEAVWIMCGVSVFDYMLFGTKLGIISSTLQYEKTPVFKFSEYLINTFAVVAAAIVLHFIYRHFQNISKTILIIGIITVVGIGGISLAEVLGSFAWYNNFSRPSKEMPEIPLSRDGKNVIVLMLDRGLGLQVPYIFNEKPELKEQYDGFTYYRNTISYGPYTIFGSPALYGGYEYTPEGMNSRPDDSLESKQNEALKVMPVIFGKNGYEVTICDPSYAGYSYVPDLSIFDDHPEFHCYNTIGRFNYFEDAGLSSSDTSARIRDIRNRNFFCFSIMKISPVLLQETLYNGGLYNESISSAGNTEGVITADALVQQWYSTSVSSGYNHTFLESYAVLMNLPKITSVTDTSENTFLMMCNETPHSFTILQEPDYVPAMHVDNTAYDVDMEARYTLDNVTMQMTTEDQITHYHVNIATFLQLGKWFDYLREQGVYDNTRIILVSDHGKDLGQFGINCNDQDMEIFFPLLMVKDFGATGFTVSDEFMTNGDTPSIATAGIIENPENPFTQNPINEDAKNGPQTVFYSDILHIEDNNGNTFFPGSWYSLDGDPHDPENWKYLGDW
ncbi:MAG: hypothetical protein IKH20_00110 [Clostridiales bacterium]|nr:hypothetical protein [Clostridiales bacterium]